MTRDELIELLSDVTSLLGTALAREVELKESLASDAADAQREKLDALKAKLAGERLKLQKLNAASKRRRELEKKRQENERGTARSAANESKNSGMVTLRDGAGRVVGFMRVMGPSRTDFFAASGRLVAREVGGKTYTATGKLAAHDRQGLRVLGQKMNSQYR